MRTMLSSVLFLGFSLLAHASDDSSLSVNAAKNSFVVKLGANPTTGYQWEVVEFDKNLLTLTSSQFQKPQSKLMGAGGQMLFTFSLNKGKKYPGETSMVFKYARSWEPESGILKKVNVKFVSRP